MHLGLLKAAFIVSVTRQNIGSTRALVSLHGWTRQVHIDGLSAVFRSIIEGRTVLDLVQFDEFSHESFVGRRQSRSLVFVGRLPRRSSFYLWRLHDHSSVSNAALLCLARFFLVKESLFLLLQVVSFLAQRRNA